MFRYRILNIRSSDQYRKYSEAIPWYFHNRPLPLVRHVVKVLVQLNDGPLPVLETSDEKKFIVKSESSNSCYEITMGTESALPTCSCRHFLRTSLLCKHICSVCLKVGWNRLGNAFSKHPLFDLDETIFDVPHDRSLEGPEVDIENTRGVSSPTTSTSFSTADQPGNAAAFPSIRSRRFASIEMAKNVLNALYVVEDNKSIEQAEGQLRDTLKILQQGCANENNMRVRPLNFRSNRRRTLQPSTALRSHKGKRRRMRYGKGAEKRHGTPFLTMFSPVIIGSRFFPGASIHL